MMLDLDIANCTRRCAAGGRALTHGERYFSTLHMENGAPVRRDFAADAWTGPPEGALAWWQSQLGEGDGGRAHLAPQDVLLNLFAALADQPCEAEFRYVLGLLLIRRRILRLEGSRRDSEGELLLVAAPQRDEQFELRVAPPLPERTGDLERKLAELLYGDTPGAQPC